MAKSKKRKKAPPRGLFLKVLLGVLAFAVCGMLLLITLVRHGVFGALPSEQDLAGLHNEEATLLLSRDGITIGKIFAKDRTNVRFEDLPTHLVNALVATEDQRFFSHEGVDAWSYMRVLVRTIIGRDRSGGGGSTISQQIIKNLYGRERHGMLTIPVNKVKEAIMAQRLERVHDKNAVLTLYFNSVPFGENVYGAEAAAQRYFGKPVKRLKVEEAAVLVGMLKANTTYNPRRYPERSKGRRDQVLELMAGRGYLSTTAKDSLRQLPLKLRYTGADAFDAYGYFAARVERDARALLKDLRKPDGSPYDLEKDGLRIHTTLDTALQQAALRTMAMHLGGMQKKLDKELATRKARAAWEKGMARKGGAAWKADRTTERELFTWAGDGPTNMSYRDSLWHYHSMLHGAVLAMEPGSGRVRAWVGGNHFRTLPYDLVEARRPIASTIKPVIYAAAVEKGFGPCDYFDNTVRSYPQYDGWTPGNYGKDSLGGQVAMWSALARSLNLPTVDLFFRTGEDTVRNTFHALGLPTAPVANPAVALGAADIPLRAIVSAYTAFAMPGQRVEPWTVERITDARGKVIVAVPAPKPVQAIKPATAATITTMLQRAVDSGTGAALRSKHGFTAPFAGKTGTSQDHSDAWFVGYSPGLVIGAWVGARDPSVHFNGAAGTGGSLALPIVGGTLRTVQRNERMRGRYLLPFAWVEEYPVEMDCPPQRSATEGFLHDLFPPKERNKDKQDNSPEERKERKNFLERLFGKKER